MKNGAEMSFGMVIEKLQSWLRKEVLGKHLVDADDLRGRAVAHFARDEAFVRALLAESYRVIREDEEAGTYDRLVQQRGGVIQPPGVEEMRQVVQGEPATDEAAAAERRRRVFEGFLLAHLNQEIGALRDEGYDEVEGKLLSREAMREYTRTRAAAARSDPTSPFFRPGGGQG